MRRSESGKFHRRSMRLPQYDYSQVGAYFITICAHGKQWLFGAIVGDKVSLTPLGRIVEEEWVRTETLRPNVRLDAYVIMPNHIHGIVILDEAGTARRAPAAERFGKPVPDSVPTVVRAFKAAVTKRANAEPKRRNGPLWQRGYYEHVVRNERDLNAIREYIANNPFNWASDSENPSKQM